MFSDENLDKKKITAPLTKAQKERRTFKSLETY